MNEKYNEIPLKTEATIEAIAVYQSLRYITNVLGCRVKDLNYSVLAALVSAINSQTVDMSLLQFCVSNIWEHAEQLFEGCPSLKMISPWQLIIWVTSITYTKL